MTDELPDPLVPPDLDLRDFTFMPVDVRRLLTSETWLGGTGDEKAAAMTLWLESWHQVPAGSLPDNDRFLAHLSQAAGKWRKVKAAALRGWVKAKDGRLYHPVVCEKAAEAWQHKQGRRSRTEAARRAREQQRRADAERHDFRHRYMADTSPETEEVPDVATSPGTSVDTNSVTDQQTRSVTDNATGSKRQGQGQGQKTKKTDGRAAAPPRPPDDYAFQGQVVRLTHEHFRQWQASFPHVDVRGVCQNFDDYLAQQPAGERKNWFIRLSNQLRRHNDEAAARLRASGGNGVDEVARSRWFADRPEHERELVGRISSKLRAKGRDQDADAVIFEEQSWERILELQRELYL